MYQFKEYNSLCHRIVIIIFIILWMFHEFSFTSSFNVQFHFIKIKVFVNWLEVSFLIFSYMSRIVRTSFIIRFLVIRISNGLQVRDFRSKEPKPNNISLVQLLCARLSPSNHRITQYLIWKPGSNTYQCSC